MKSVKEEYKQFLNTSYGINCYNEFKAILYSAPDSLIEKFNSKFLSNDFIPSKQTLNICDIGGGDGKRIIQILDFLHKKYNKSFHLDFIEQSQFFCNSFKANNNTIRPFSSIIVQNKLFENSILKRKYDFIFLIHSIFTFQNTSTIDRLLSLTNSDGKIILFSNAHDSFLDKLKKELDQEYVDNRLEINDIKNILKNFNISYQSHSFYTKWIIPEKEFDTKIDIILEWLSLGQYNNYSSKRKNELYDLIYKLTEFHNGKYYFKENEEIIIFHGKYPT